MQERGGIRTTGLSIDGRPIMTEVDDLKKIREENGYYVDKSALIDELLRKKKEVYLFTRPRRFGKSMAENMLTAYYSKGCDSRFQREICRKSMVRRPLHI